MKARHHSLILKVPLFIVLIFSLIPITGADETSEQTTGIIVEGAHATIHKERLSAGLEFSVTNMGPRDVTLLGLSSDLAESIEVYFFEDGKRSIISDLTILQEETLDLASSHIKIELIGIKRKLSSGSTFEFILNFRDFKTTAVAHVHE